MEEINQFRNDLAAMKNTLANGEAILNLIDRQRETNERLEVEKEELQRRVTELEAEIERQEREREMRRDELLIVLARAYPGLRYEFVI